LFPAFLGASLPQTANGNRGPAILWHPAEACAPGFRRETPAATAGEEALSMGSVQILSPLMPTLLRGRMTPPSPRRATSPRPCFP